MVRHAVRVPLLVLCLAACATGRSSDDGERPAPREAPPTIAAPPPPREAPPPTPPGPAPTGQRGAWMIEVRNGQDVIWFGGWTPAETESSCQARQRQFQERSGPALEITPCGYHDVLDRPPGTEIWIAPSPRAFVGAPTEADCARAAATVASELARNAPGFTLPACERMWIRTR